MDTLRWPAFIVACLSIVMVVGLETGAHWLARAQTPSIDSSAAGQYLNQQIAEAELKPADVAAHSGGERPPGMALPQMAFLDGLLLFTVAMMAAPAIWSDRVQGKLLGLVTLIFSILILLAALKLIMRDFGQLMLMITLAIGTPFGMLAYLLRWGFFDVGGATTLLAALLSLKILFLVALVVAHQRFLQNKGLLLLVGFSFLAHVLVKILHAIVPSPFVSITDAVGAVIILVIVLLWGLYFLISSIPAVFKAVF